MTRSRRFLPSLNLTRGSPLGATRFCYSENAAFVHRYSESMLWIPQAIEVEANKSGAIYRLYCYCDPFKTNQRPEIVWLLDVGHVLFVSAVRCL